MPAFKGFSGISGSMTGQSVATATRPNPVSRALSRDVEGRGRVAATVPCCAISRCPGRALSPPFSSRAMGPSADGTIDLRGGDPARRHQARGRAGLSESLDAGRDSGPWPALKGDTIFQSSGFSWAKVALGPCGPHPPSYMRLTVAISRAIDRLGVWIGVPSGPSQPAAKRRT